MHLAGHQNKIKQKCQLIGMEAYLSAWTCTRPLAQGNGDQIWEQCCGEKVYFHRQRLCLSKAKTVLLWGLILDRLFGFFLFRCWPILVVFLTMFEFFAEWPTRKADGWTCWRSQKTRRKAQWRLRQKAWTIGQCGATSCYMYINNIK